MNWTVNSEAGTNKSNILNGGRARVRVLGFTVGTLSASQLNPVAAPIHELGHNQNR